MGFRANLILLTAIYAAVITALPMDLSKAMQGTSGKYFVYAV